MYTRIYLLHFLKDTSEQPIIYRFVKEFDIEFNILKADISPQREGMMILELRGKRENIRDGLKFLESHGVTIKELATVVSRDEQKCYQCGACTGVCPVKALDIDRDTMEVVFDPEKCTGCGQCVRICPVRAMQVSAAQDIISQAV